MERRFIPTTAEIRDGDSPVIAGYAAVFHRSEDPGTEFELWDGAVERIQPGAFDRAIREDDVRGLRNHEVDNLLGRSKSGTLRLFSDDKGLRYELDPPDNELGRSTLEAIRRGDLDGSSFAFQVTDEEWRKEDGVAIRDIKGVRLYDVGPVTFPAYEASTTGVRQVSTAEARDSFDRHEAAKGYSRDYAARRLRLAETSDI